MAWAGCCAKRAAGSKRAARRCGWKSRRCYRLCGCSGRSGLQLDEGVIASDVQALIEALVRRSREDPLTGVVLLEYPDLLEELERWPGWGLRWVWVRSHKGNVHHNRAHGTAYRMASMVGKASDAAAPSTVTPAPWFTS